jgi:predicted ester cyclase
MSAEENSALGRHFFAEQDRLRGGPAPELCAANYAAHLNTYELDLAGHQQFASAFYAGFPDLHHTVTDAVADERGVAVRFRINGTNTGDFMGMPATSKPVEFWASAVIGIEDGKVVSLKAVFDQLTMMRQLGAIPD